MKIILFFKALKDCFKAVIQVTMDQNKIAKKLQELADDLNKFTGKGNPNHKKQGEEIWDYWFIEVSHSKSFDFLKN
jgi:hypothetical protein